MNEGNAHPYKVLLGREYLVFVLQTTHVSFGTSIQASILLTGKTFF